MFFGSGISTSISTCLENTTTASAGKKLNKKELPMKTQYTPRPNDPEILIHIKEYDNKLFSICRKYLKVFAPDDVRQLIATIKELNRLHNELTHELVLAHPEGKRPDPIDNFFNSLTMAMNTKTAKNKHTPTNKLAEAARIRRENNRR